MLSSYRQIFAASGSLAFSLSGFIARMPISMTGIGIVTMLSQLRGSYGLAAWVSGTMAGAAAVLGPAVSWLVDRHGQRRVTLPATAITVLAAVGLLLCARSGAPTWTLFVCAFGMGVMPSTGSMVRARWAYLYNSSPPKLHTAYSFEAVVDEVCFIIGPILSITLATSVFPEAGIMLAGVFLTVGVLLFTAQRRTEPPVHPAEHHTGGPAILSGGLQVLVVTFVATGAVFGSVEVVTLAFAEEQGHKSWTGLVLAVYALGSCLAGVIFGTLKLKGSMATRFPVGAAVMAASMVPLLLVGELVHGVGGLLAISAALFVAGFSISPTLITAMALVERLIPAAKLTEGMTWTTTGLALGVALGSSAAGLVVDAQGAPAGYWVPLSAAAFGMVVAFAGLPRLRSGLATAEAELVRT
ncbi:MULTISPECIES: MFS transporter [unclassified Kitasatospora]|uniref:MFS transporter n=1 Tax=unclassified Kitasatospora TaxID=2633591 RepID=UPI000709A0DD|nr:MULTISPECIES: MFS transporter [unclassified Kitasatospora]KQV21229.1 MFS transporter [Kitasatospora sp. Root107]KRB69418.1 MFS transporter [Kitasatospora sp. Root187]